MMDWKEIILKQLQEKNSIERDLYADIVKHYNRLLENYSITLMRCTEQERDILSLRQENTELQKNSARIPDLPRNDRVKSLENEYMKAKDEILALLRERGDMTKEVISLSRIVKERDDKLSVEENRSLALTKENIQLKQKVETLQENLDVLKKVNETIHDEFQTLQLANDALEGRYRQLADTNELLRKKISECLEQKFKKMDEDIERHEEERDRKVQDKLDEARNDDNLSPTRTPNTDRSMKGNESATSRKLVSETYRAALPSKVIDKWDCGDNELHVIQFHPSGSMLATGGSDRKIHIWEIDLYTSKVQPLHVLSGNNSTVTAIDFDEESGNLVLGCSEDFACRVWGLSDQRLRHTLTGHGAKVFCAKFITSTSIVSGSHDRTLKAWDLQNRQCVRTLFAGSKCHDLVALDRSGNLISGHFDKKIRFWDTRNDTTRGELQFQAAITSLSINREKRLLLACSRDDTLKLIELRENRVMQTYSHPDFKVSSDTIRAVLSPDCNYVCAGGSDGTVYIWDAKTAKIEKVLNKEHSTVINAVAWQPQGRFIASCERQRRAVLWGE